MTDLVKLYNPSSASALTPEQIEGLQKLSLDQIKELAKAYPNRLFPRAYLLIKDLKSKIPIERQIATMGTFESVYNNNAKNGGKIIAIGFRGQTKPVVTNKNNVRPKASQVVDLSDTELMDLPGFKMAANVSGIAETVPPTTVQVTKVKKVKK